MLWVAVGLCGAGPGDAALVRGVAPEEQGRYAFGSTFRCLSGGGEVPFTAVNDNFCDCGDGSDEPGTGACAGQDQTLFHCANEGSTPQLVYASRVGDGICDCCDGSDEEALVSGRGGAQCANHCAEEGQREAKARAERLDQLRTGLAKKEEIKRNARADRQQWTAHIAKLADELPVLEAAVEAAKKMEQEAVDTAAAAAGGVSGAAAEGELQAEVSALRVTVDKQQAQIDSLLRDVTALKERGASVTAAAEGAAGGAVAADDGKKVVSEYAKWMDGADSTPGALGDAEYASEDDESGGEEEEQGLGLAQGAGVQAVTTSGNSVAVTEAQAKVSKNKEEATTLKKKLGAVDEDRLGFASLEGQCISKNDGQYTYKFCFFNDAKQDHVLLGRWKGWTGIKAAEFTDGQMCPGGPARSLRVIFECGAEQAVLEITEPSRCIYEAHIVHPGACNEEDAAALEKPPVKHPKDEL